MLHVRLNSQSNEIRFFERVHFVCENERQCANLRQGRLKVASNNRTHTAMINANEQIIPMHIRNSMQLDFTISNITYSDTGNIMTASFLETFDYAQIWSALIYEIHWRTFITYQTT